MKIRKAIIPVAGLGTRFLPASKAVPKVLLPVFDTPAIHFVVNEALYAGIEHLIFVISPQQDMIKNYFSNSSELELELGKRGHPNKLDEIKYFQNNLRLDYVYQSKQLGLGHAILLAEKKNLRNICRRKKYHRNFYRRTIFRRKTFRRTFFRRIFFRRNIFSANNFSPIFFSAKTLLLTHSHTLPAVL